MSSFIGTNPHQVPTNGDLGRLAFLDYLGVSDVGTYIPTIASSTAISPTTQISYVSGISTISTIVPPVTLFNGGQITLIPTGKFILSTNDNIAMSVSAQVSRPIILTYESSVNKWYPSYSDSVNRVTITPPATSSTLTVADGKTVILNSTLTVTGTDNKTLTVNKNVTLDGIDDKTLTLNSSVTLSSTNNNAVVLNLRSGGTVVYTTDSVGKLTGGGTNQIAYQTATDVTGFIAAPTTANTVLTYNGTSLVWAGSGLTPTAIKVANGYTAAANDLVRCNTTTTAFSISLPASPLDGTILAFVDVANSFATHNLTINPNGNKIEGSTSSMVSNVNGAYLEFTYISSTTNWKMLQAPLTVSSIVATGTLSATTYLAGDGSWKSLSALSLTATGTKDATTYLAGDNTWKSLSALSLTATGTKDATTYLAGDNTWKSLSALSLTATGTKDATTYLAGDNTWKSIKETSYTPSVSGSGSVSISVDFSTVNSTTIIINLPSGVTGATITFTNLSSIATSGTVFSFSVIVSHTDALSSNTSVVFRHGASLLPKWTGGIVPPSTTTAAAIDIWSFFTYDAGSSLVGSLAMSDVK
jgi:hypothetical protein